MKVEFTVKKKGGGNGQNNRAYKATTFQNMQKALDRFAHDYKEHMISMHNLSKNINGDRLLDNKNGEPYSWSYQKKKALIKPSWQGEVDLDLTGNFRKNLKFLFNRIEGSDTRGMSVTIVAPRPTDISAITIPKKLTAKFQARDDDNFKVSKSYIDIFKLKGENFRMNKNLQEKFINVIKRNRYNSFTVNFFK